MAAWGGVGLAGAGLARVAGRELGRIPLAAACAVASLGFGAVMNLHLWVTYSGDHTAAKLAAIFATSLPFDIAHATGSALFCLAFGPALVHALSRYRRRFEVRWAPAPAVTVVLLALVAVAVAAPAARAQHATDAAAARASVRYLVEAQNDDGGWGGSPGQSSSQLYTGWTAIGLAAAGRNPRDVGSPSAVAYIRDHAGELNDLGEINRTIIVLVAAGVEPRLGDRDLVAELLVQAAAQRLLRRPREHDRVLDPGAARGRPRAALARRPPRGRLHRRRGQLRRRLQLRRPGRPVGDRRHQRGAPGAGRRRPPPQRRRQARGALHRPQPGLRRRLRARAGRGLQRAVDRLGDPGPGRRRPRPGQGQAQQLARPDELPALADRRRRLGPLLAQQPADAGVGHRAGRRRAVAQGAAAEARAAREARHGDATATVGGHADARRADAARRARRRPSSRSRCPRWRPPRRPCRPRSWPRPRSRPPASRSPRCWAPARSCECASCAPAPIPCGADEDRCAQGDGRGRAARRHRPRRRAPAQERRSRGRDRAGSGRSGRSARRRVHRRGRRARRPVGRRGDRPRGAERARRPRRRPGADRVPRAAHERRRASRRSPRPARPRSRWSRSRASAARSRWTPSRARRPSPATCR